MAEEPNKLSNTNESDAISTAAGAQQDDLLEVPTDDYSFSEAEVSEIPENTPEETEHLKAQIEETRLQMGETIDAIQEKLSFQNISEQVKEQVSEQVNNVLETAKKTVYDGAIENIGKAGNFMKKVGKELSKTDVGKVARKNPFPLVLIGLGIGLLAYEGFSGKKRRAYQYDDGDGKSRKHQRNGRISSSVATLKSATEKVGSAASSALGSVSGATSNALHTVGDAASSAYGTVSGAASSAYGSVTGAASNAYSSVNDFAGNAYEKAGDYSGQAREQYDYYIEENPLAVGAVALALGAAVGLAIPSTRYEGELLGEYREQLLDKAQAAAGGLVDRVKDAAAEAQKTIGNEVKTAVNEAKNLK